MSNSSFIQQDDDGFEIIESPLDGLADGSKTKSLSDLNIMDNYFDNESNHAEEQLAGDYHIIDILPEEEFEHIEAPKLSYAERANDFLSNITIFNAFVNCKAAFNTVKDSMFFYGVSRFLYSSPILSTIGLVAVAGSYLVDKSNEDNNNSLSKRAMGMSVLAATAISGFYFPLAAMGLAMVCSSDVQNLVRGGVTALVGTDIPKPLAIPMIFTLGVIGKIGKSSIKEMWQADSLYDRAIKTLVLGVSNKVEDVALAIGYRHFEQVAGKFTGSMARIFSNIFSTANVSYTKAMDVYRPEREYEIVDAQNLANDNSSKVAVSTAVKDLTANIDYSYCARILAERQQPSSMAAMAA